MILMTLKFRGIFSKNTIKFHENPASGSRVVPCGRAYGRTDTTKLRVIFRNFVSAANKAFSQFET